MPTLDWLNKAQALTAAAQVPYRLLEPQSVHGDPAADNWLIQGDNLHALKALLPFFAGRVKCVYIDPPYNKEALNKAIELDPANGYAHRNLGAVRGDGRQPGEEIATPIATRRPSCRPTCQVRWSARIEELLGDPPDVLTEPGNGGEMDRVSCLVKRDPAQEEVAIDVEPRPCG